MATGHVLTLPLGVPQAQAKSAENDRIEITSPDAMSMPTSGRRLSFLLVTWSYPPVLGGSELEAQRVCAAMAARGHRVRVVCAGHDAMPRVREWLDSEGIPVRIFASGFRGRLQHIAFALRVAGILIQERNEYQVVYFLMQGLHLALGLLAARGLRKPILVKISGGGIIPTMAGTRAGRLELRWIKKWAHKLMLLNQGMMEEAYREGFVPEQLYWMPNPVNIDEFAPFGGADRTDWRVRFGIGEDAKVVLYCGRLAPEKAARRRVSSSFWEQQSCERPRFAA